MHAAAAPWQAQAGAPSTLRQCLVLAALLHVLAVLVFGNTAGGTAAPGQGVWGVLNIRLAGIDPAGRADATVASDAYSGPQGQARERRWGGAVRAPQDRPDAHGSPGAARQGVWQPQPVPDAAPGPSPEVPPAATADLAPAADAAPAPVAAPAGLPVPAPVTEPVPAPVPADLPAVVSAPAAAPDRVPLPARPAEASVPIAPWRLPAPAAPATLDLPLPALNLPAPPPPPSPLPSPAPSPAPVPAPVPAPEPALPPRSAPARPVRPAGVQAPALAAPAAGPMPLPGLAMPPPEPQPAARSPAPRALPAPIAPPTAAELPAVQAPAVQTLPADAVPASVPAAAPAAATTTAAATAANATPAAAAAPAVMAPAGTAAASPRPAAGSVDLTGRSTGAPDAGAQVGHDVATAPALPASAPRLNLTLVRPLGGPVSAQGARGLLPVLPHPPEQANKLSRDIEKAGQPDCRQAYADKGLLAVLPLVADAVRDKGCRW